MLFKRGRAYGLGISEKQIENIGTYEIEWRSSENKGELPADLHKGTGGRRLSRRNLVSLMPSRGHGADYPGAFNQWESRQGFHFCRGSSQQQ